VALVYSINYAFPKVHLAYSKRKLSTKLDESKELLKDAPELLSAYGSLLEKTVASENPYDYPVLEEDQSHKKKGNAHYKYLDQTVKGIRGLVIRNSGLGIPLCDIKYAQP